MMIDLLAAFTWSPGFKGILTVAVAVAILCGSTALILGTNSGARLGFLLALTGLFGWFVVMGLVWSTYGIGPKGPAPTWKVVDTVSGDPGQSRVEKADSLPLPSDLPNAVETRDADPELVKLFPKELKDPVLGDLVMVDEPLLDSVNDQLAPWEIIPTSNKYTGETQSVVAEVLGPEDEALFESAGDYVVINSYLTGGKARRTDDSIVGRVKYKITSALTFKNEPFYAAVQLQAVIPQETKPGQAPPLPVANPDAPVYTVVLERDRGALRLPAISFTFFSTVVFGVCCVMLHNRDKLATAQRAATTPAGAA